MMRRSREEMYTSLIKSRQSAVMTQEFGNPERIIASRGA